MTAFFSLILIELFSFAISNVSRTALHMFFCIGLCPKINVQKPPNFSVQY